MDQAEASERGREKVLWTYFPPFLRHDLKTASFNEKQFSRPFHGRLGRLDKRVAHHLQTRQTPARLLRSFFCGDGLPGRHRSEEHTSELQSQSNLVCRLLLYNK